VRPASSLTRAARQRELKDASRARFVLCDSGSGKGLGYIRLAPGAAPLPLPLPELVKRALQRAQATGQARAKCAPGAPPPPRGAR
jgi:hypothetical protein